MANTLIRYINKHWIAVIVVCAFVAFIINVLIFYPGYMSRDSISMVRTVTGLSRPSDLAPTAMGMVWVVLYNLTGSIASMLIFQLLMLWSALALLAIYVFINTKSKKLSFLVLILGILPFVINISGVMWRDNQMAFAMMLAVAIMLYVKFVKNKYWRIAMFSGALILILYASLIRYNAIFAVLPIIFLAIRYSGFVRRLRWQIIFTALACPIIIFGLFPLVDFVTNPIKSNPSVILALDDVENMSSNEELKKLTISAPAKETLINVKKCVTEKTVLTGAFWACTNDDERQGMWFRYGDEIKKVWVSAILKHPFEYASYRAEVYFVFLFPPTNSFYIFEDGITPNDNGLKVQFKRLGTITSKYVNNWGYKYFPFMFEPWFWLFASAAMVAITKKRSKHRLYISMLGLSSVLYILGYFPTGATVDYRYIYWPVLATLFGLVLLVIDRFREKRKVK